MDINGFLKKCLVACTLPVCASCLYGKATKIPCNTKTEISINKSKLIASVGECVSTNVLVSITHGIIVNIYGFIMHQHYQYACVFVDYHSDFKYVHILKYKTADEVVEANEDFEAYGESRGVDTKQYHAENILFRSAICMNQCSDIHQGLTFSGVNFHHQNGIAERRIRSLQDLK